MWKALAIVTGITVGATFAVDAVHLLEVKNEAFNYAKRLSAKRGIINIGAGPHRSPFAQTVANSPEVMANIDIVADGIPNFIQLDVEKQKLPFPDNSFDVAFLSHILEHLNNWQFALSEACRVADHVVVVLPHPLSPSGWLHPQHKQHFNFEDIKRIQQQFPKVTIFC